MSRSALAMSRQQGVLLRFRTLGRFELVNDDPFGARAPASQPKRLALLAYLALAAPGGSHRRDTLLALFWPELDEEHGRLALRQALHALRRSLDSTAVIQSLADDRVALAGDHEWCDAVAFERAIAERRDADALAAYGGSFFDGVFIADASPGLEQWVGMNRARLSESASAAATRLAIAAREAGDPASVVRWAERAWAIAPDDEMAVRFLMGALGRTGDRTRALRVYEIFAKRIEAELDAEPDDETEALAETLRFAPAVELTGAASSAAAPHVVAEDHVTTVATMPTAALSAATEGNSRAHASERDKGPRTASIRGWATTAVLAAAIIAAAVLPRASLSTVTSLGHSRDSAAVGVANPTQAVVARHLYDEGVQAYSAQDPVEAEKLFQAAIASDSTFAMAAYYAARTNMRDDHSDLERTAEFFKLATRPSSHATDRERLLIAEASADFGNDPARLAFAETLAVRYPSDPVGQFQLGHDRMWSGAFLAAIAPLHAAFVLDSANFSNARHDCLACDALRSEIVAYRYADSLPAAERVAREWIRRAPSSPAGWRELAVVLGAESRFADARKAYAESADLSRGGSGITRDMADLAIREGDFAAADRLLAGDLAGGSAQDRQEALWLYVVSLRFQGRLHDAFKAAQLLRSDKRRSGARQNVQMYSALPEAQVLLEMGRARDAATLFDSVGHVGARALRPGLDARHMVWTATLTAEALASARDSSAVIRLVGPVGEAGTNSAYGRDRLLVNHLRGLVLMMRGDATGAASAFHRAIFSAPMGYTRSNYDLARALLALGRSGDAIVVLHSAFAGELSASSMYVTRTDLHELLAQAFDKNGSRDSAIVHYRAVTSALAHADAELVPRRNNALARLAVLERGR